MSVRRDPRGETAWPVLEVQGALETGRRRDGRTRAQRFVLTLSRLWAWAFLGLMIVFFVIAVPIDERRRRSTS